MDHDVLPGERVLWTGRPERRGRRGAGESLTMVYVLVAVPLGVWFFLPGGSGDPGFGRAALVVFLAAWLLQCAVYIWYLVVTVPRLRRSEAYAITDLRVLATVGLRRRLTVSAWLARLPEPAVRGGKDGLADLVFPDPGPGAEERLRKRAARGVTSMFRPSPGAEPPEFRSLAGAEQARAVAAGARQAMLDGTFDAPSRGAGVAAVPEWIPLGTGERVLWTGRAERLRWWYGPADAGLSLWGLFVLVYAVLMAAGIGEPAPLVWIGLIALLIGGYPALGRLLLRRARARRCLYVLTDRQLITAWRLHRPVIVAAPLSGLGPPVLDADEIHTFWDTPRPRKRGGPFAGILWPLSTDHPPNLVGLAGPREVLAAICAAQLAALAPEIR
jgi:hypothetical protein